MKSVTKQKLTVANQANLANEILYGLGIACARIGALFLYLRVFAEDRLQKATKIFMATSTILVMVVVLWDIFTCRPVSVNWNMGLKGECGDRKAPYIFACIVGIASDTVALILPMPLIWRLNTRRSNKINLQCLFAFGLRYVASALLIVIN